MKSIIVAAFVLLLLPASSYAAGKLATPSGPVVLTIDGNISSFNASDRKAKLDLDMLKALGITAFDTNTPWMDGMSGFEGVMLRDVLQAVGAAGKTVTAYAADGYSNEIEMTDFERYNVILAYSQDGKMLATDDKGPLWIMYPFDAHPNMDIEEMATHAVWQLTRLEVQ